MWYLDESKCLSCNEDYIFINENCISISSIAINTPTNIPSGNQTIENTTIPTTNINIDASAKELTNVQTKVVKNKDYSSILLCSDGLYNMISDEIMEEILANDELTTNAKAQKMIDLALANGGSDNITVAIMEK